MKRVVNFVVIVGLAAEALVLGQGGDAGKVLAQVREALGGDKKIAAVKTVAASGRSVKVSGETSGAPADFEFAMELPDKYMKKEVLAMLGNNAITHTSGFNGDDVISATDTPPNLGGGRMVIQMGPGGPAPGVPPTPEQQAAMRKAALASAHEDFARLTLGMFASSYPAFPLEFSYAGQAESPDGKADVIGVKGPYGFDARLFVDTSTHLPLMLSWMAKEPLVISNTSGSGPGRAGSSGGASVVQFGSGTGQQMTPEQRDQMMKDMQERMKEAQAKLRTVEYRVYYSDYQDVSGVRMPFKLQRSIDGKPSEEMTLEKVKVNQKIDPKKFEVEK